MKKILLLLFVFEILNINTVVFGIEDYNSQKSSNIQSENIDPKLPNYSETSSVPPYSDQINDQDFSKSERNDLHSEEENLRNDISVIKTVHNDAPKWEEYVAPKYRYPRTDFRRGSSVAEIVAGAILTDLILTAPIGIPMIIHGTTRVKMVSYANRKNIFDKEMAKADLITDDIERAAAYKKILKKCHLKESTRQYYARKEKETAAKQTKNNTAIYDNLQESLEIQD